MDKLRLKFSKTGRAAYISHLDLMRTMQRAFMRADIPIKYSEGFNPHAVLSFALPLSVGTESVCELADFGLRGFMGQKEIDYRLRRSLPEGIGALEIYRPERRFKEIKWLDIEGVFEYDSREPDEMASGLAAFFEGDAIVIARKTKSGMGEADIAPAIRSVSFDRSGKNILLNATISAQEPTLNPGHLVSALKQLAPDFAPDFAAFRRVCLYDKDMEIFR